MDIGVGIKGIGIYVPQEKVSVECLLPEATTEDLLKLGVSHSRIERELSATEMATRASKAALEEAGISPLDVDLIVNTQSSLHDYLVWQVSAEIQRSLAADNAVFYDLYQACSGMVMGIISAKDYLIAESKEYALVCTSEKWEHTVMNRILGKMVLSDCAAAVILQSGCDSNRILGYACICLGEFNDVCRMDVGAINSLRKEMEPISYYYHYTSLEKAINGMIPINIETFRQVAMKALHKANLSLDAIDYLIIPGIATNLFTKIADSLGFPLERTNIKFVRENGDCSSCDAMLNYYLMTSNHIVLKGDRCLILSMGAGATWAAIIIQA